MHIMLRVPAALKTGGRSSISHHHQWLADFRDKLSYLDERLESPMKRQSPLVFVSSVNVLRSKWGNVFLSSLGFTLEDHVVLLYRSLLVSWVGPILFLQKWNCSLRWLTNLRFPCLKNCFIVIQLIVYSYWHNIIVGLCKAIENSDRVR